MFVELNFLFKSTTHISNCSTYTSHNFWTGTLYVQELIEVQDAVMAHVFSRMESTKKEEKNIIMPESRL